MTRELPFDDDAGAGEEAGDAAYRVATGVARVARAGAYVTGGALIASNGSPAPENESHNSHFTGWSTVDPDPDVPSPVVTYPDPSPDSVPPDLGTYSAPQPPPAPGNVFADEYGTDVFPVPQFPFAEQAPPPPGVGGLPSTPQGGTDAPFSIPGSDAPNGGLDTFDFPGSGGNQGFSIPGSHPADTADSSDGLGFPGWGTNDSGLGLPRQQAAEDDRQHGGDLSGADTHPTAPLPGHGLGLPGTNGLNLPGMNGLGPGGLGWGDDVSGAGAPDYDGVGDGGNPGIFFGAEMNVDAHIGLDGIWLTTETKVDFAVGDVGSQLDDYGQWLGSGVGEIPGGAPSSADAGVPGALGAAVAPSAGAEPAAVGAAGVPVEPGAAQASTAGAQGVATSQSVAGSSQSVAATQSASVSGQHAAIAPAPAAPAAFPAPQMASVAAPQPITTAPVVAAPAPPPPAPAPVPVQPVASTPLQTTIQPEAATHPVANVITAHPGPSPLTAPAAAVPALFDYQPANPVPEVEFPGTGADDSSGTSTTTHAPTSTPHPSTSHPGTSHPSTSPGTSHSTTPTTGSGHSSVVAPTGTPGTTTSPGTSTGRDTTEHGTPTTTRPGSGDSTGTGATHPPSTSAGSDSGSDSGHSGGDSGQVTTPGTTGPDATTSVPGATHSPGTSSGADTSAPGTADGSVGPTPGNAPSSDHDTGPTQQVPTQSMPTQHTQQPTAPHTADPGAGMPAHTAPAAPTAVKPPTTIDPVPDAGLPVEPISYVSASPDAGVFADSGHGLTSVAPTGLSAGLHDTGYAESHHLVLHPVADLHLTL